MNVAIYLRRSTDRQEQSVDDQRRAIERYAAEHGHTIIREYVDDAISGAITEDRKSFLRMIEEAQTKPVPFRAVLCYDVSRFGRTDQDEAGYYRYLLSQAGIEIIYIAENFNGDETDDLMRPVKQYMAHKMVLDLSKVTLRGQVSRASKGRWCGGRPPYGYDLLYHDAQGTPFQVARFRSTGEREIRTLDGAVLRVIPRGESLPATESDWTELVPGDPTRIAVIRKIFDWYVTHEIGFGGIASRLNAERVPTAGARRRGNGTAGGWSVGTVREILLNPAYKGAHAWNRRTFAKFHTVKDGRAVSRAKTDIAKVARNDKADWVLVEGNHAPLVSPEVWARAQIVLKSKAVEPSEERKRSYRRGTTYMLAGLVECGRCRHRWQGYRIYKGRKRAGVERPYNEYYCCSGYKKKGNATCKRALVSQEEFEQVVITAVAAEIGDFISIGGSSLLERLVLEEVGPRAEATALEEKLAADRKKLDDLIDCLTPALAPTLEPRIVALKRDIELTEAALKDRAQAALSAAEARDAVERLVGDLGQIQSTMERATYPELRDIVRGMTSKIELDPETGEAKMIFHAIPRVGTINEQGQTGCKSLSGLDLVAGEGFEPPTSGL